ncbi:Nudix family hydrolase [Hahella sp. CCB-MM4]|uniref:Nudix family hydrolase n=1 Tax=Hahella sp. (strain CCB-MM4) TaxID=1926491 RepID=UPI00143DD489|nr:Nudix family hydrolase [Hahella sp. CCB-MM4]
MKSVHVAVAVLFDADGKLVIARRPDHLHQGGLLEFPGGKVEVGELVEDALVRELKEELGVDVSASPKQPLICIEFTYPDKSVYLDVWTVQGFDGVPHGREGQSLFRMNMEELRADAFPAANKPIIDALKLPDRCVITGEYDDEQDLCLKMERVLAQGVRMLVLRAPQLSMQAYEEWVAFVVGSWRKRIECLIVHGELGLSLIKSTDLPVDGCHLSSRLLSAFTDRPIPSSMWLGASCHSVAEIERAARLQCQYGFVSPALPTLSHPGGKVLGWEGIEKLSRCSTFPVFALGGVNDSHIPAARMAGCQGVAGIRAWWEND